MFIAAGASAGVSCAFGAPLGGALFAYEMSKTTTFWKFQMIWKIFVSCAVANITFAFLNSLFSGEELNFTTSTLKFGEGINYEHINNFP